MVPTAAKRSPQPPRRPISLFLVGQTHRFCNNAIFVPVQTGRPFFKAHWQVSSVHNSLYFLYFLHAAHPHLTERHETCFADPILAQIQGQAGRIKGKRLHHICCSLVTQVLHACICVLAQAHDECHWQVLFFLKSRRRGREKIDKQRLWVP
eukprot:scaffold170705_cov15-Tisochrysis_lutea.AAC.1